MNPASSSSALLSHYLQRLKGHLLLFGEEKKHKMNQYSPYCDQE